MTGHEEKLQQARATGDRDQIANALTVHATALVESGELDRARQALDEAASLHKDQGRKVDEARCLCFAATLCRGLGKLDLAETRASRADRIAPDGSAPQVSAPTELGELFLMRHEFAAAAEHFERALELGKKAELTAQAQAALHRRIAETRAQAGADDGLAKARAHLETAIACYRTAGDDAEARRTAVELTTALESAGSHDDADALMESLSDEAEAAGDNWILADLRLLSASRAIDADDVDAALLQLGEARARALEGGHPVAYVSSVLAIAELHESRGDRVDAYAALAVGWATLGDLLGEQAAKSTFEPKLEQQRQRWGDDSFAEARDAYYTLRAASQPDS